VASQNSLARYSFAVAAVAGAFVIYVTCLLKRSRETAMRAENTELALRRAVAAREQMLGVVAHDLRNPLTTIMQSTALAQRQLDPGRLNNRLEAISKAADRMNHLIQGLLDVSLIESGQLTIEHGRVSTADLVLEAVEMQMPLASSSGIELRVDLSRNVDDLSGSRERLHEALENLIGHAIKFKKAGGHITVGAASRDSEVLFWVADIGPAIGPEDLAHVFDPLWQSVPKAGRLGAALGLAITKGIVEAHGGRIWVENVEGRGRTFFFKIPKAPTDANQRSDASPSQTASDR
jgi:signal transduction histidine kinase